MGNLNRAVLAAAGMIALTATTHADTAFNGLQTNGVLWSNGLQTNGLQTNGLQTNGLQTNGLQTNGLQTNGLQTNGVTLASVAVNGTQVQGSFIGSGSATIPYTCAHREDVTGAALPSTCSPCAQTMASYDSYCTSTAWDGVCVSKAIAQCKATLSTGSILTANLTDGSQRTMRVGTRYQGGVVTDEYGYRIVADNTDVWTQNINWVLPHTPSTTGAHLAAGQVGNACVKAVCAADNYCCNNSWDQQCVNEASSMCTGLAMGIARVGTTGDSVCGYDANTGSARQAMFVGGLWDMRSGFQGAGGKIAAPAGQFSIACRGAGAIAKCVDMGYKPWKSTAQDALHQSCVRMVRADYCGDGTPWTVDGTSINVVDYAGIQKDTQTWTIEGTWSPKGARYLWHTRLFQNPVRDANAYIAAHPYCTYNPSTGWGFQAVSAWGDQTTWNASKTLDAAVNLLRTEAPCTSTDPLSPCAPG